MKTKKLLPVLALILGMSSLSACTENDQNIEFGNYWNSNATVAYEQIDETLTYGVTFEKAAGYEALGYTLSYSDGTYVTQLKSEQLDGKNVYRYTTALNIKVTYQYGTSEPVTLEDSIVTESVFLDAANNLRPISSSKKVISNSPNNGGASKVENCYISYNYEITTTYNENGKNATCKIVNNAKPDAPVTQETAFSISTKKYSYLDNEQLLFALRGFPSNSSSSKVQIYSPFLDTTQKINLSFSSEEGKEFTLKENGEDVKKNITYIPVSLTIDGNNPGATQKAWIAKTTNPQKNTNRNVMLQLETPLSYNIGKLVYTLNSVTR